MKKSVHSPEYQLILAKLISMRKQAGLTQRDLAKRLGREHSFVWRIESGERRLDVLEFHWVCVALGQNSALMFSDLFQSFTANQDTEEAPLMKVAEGRTVYRAGRKK